MKYGIFIAAFLIITLLACSYASINQLTSKPRVLNPKETSVLLRRTGDTPQISGVEFFKGSLYVSSNIGLLEYQNNNLSHLYSWYSKDDVISGPWLDMAGQNMWLYHAGLGKLIRYDGATWTLHELPTPEGGYTRGDILHGFQGVGNENGFWLQGSCCAWHWNIVDKTWDIEPKQGAGIFEAIVPVGNRVITIVRYDNFADTLASTPPPEHVVKDKFYSNEGGKWQELPTGPAMSFHVQRVVTAKDRSYVLTDEGRIIQLTSSNVTPIEAPEACEAITVMSSGELLASFSNRGIYKYSDGWNRVFPSPYPPTEEDHWAYLAENNGLVALAITPKPQMLGQDKQGSGVTTLWISEGNTLKRVSIGNN